jgi:O-antigen/teichoic acid export membrane protein
MQYLIPHQKYKEFTISVAFGAITNIFLNIILIPLYKSIGASVSALIAELIVTTMQFYFIRKEIKIIKLIILCKNYIICSLIMTIIMLFIGHIISNKTFLTMLFQFIIGFATYLLSLYILKDESVICIKQAIKRGRK